MLQRLLSIDVDDMHFEYRTREGRCMQCALLKGLTMSLPLGDYVGHNYMGQ